MKGFFVTGTDTGVGKTVASRAMIQALQKRGYSIEGYNLMLGDAQTECPPETEGCLSLFEGEQLNHAVKDLVSGYPLALVEGRFGWHSLITPHLRCSDWVYEHQLPVVLIVGIKEGCINHALLTVEGIENRGIRLLGWVSNRINPCLSHYHEIMACLQARIDAPLLGQIPYISHPERQDLSRYMTNIEGLVELIGPCV